MDDKDLAGGWGADLPAENAPHAARGVRHLLDGLLLTTGGARSGEGLTPSLRSVPGREGVIGETEIHEQELEVRSHPKGLKIGIRL
jgi:hypothetical protein